MQCIFCHEYFHYLESVLYAGKGFRTRWKELNPLGFSYFDADLYLADPNSLYREHPSPGLCNGYCQADVYQDRAEVFSHIFVPTLYERALPWIEEDVILRSKFEEMQKNTAHAAPGFRWQHVW